MSSPAAEASSGPGAPDGVECPLFDVHVSPAGHVLAVGAYNLACASPDGGQHWRAVQLDNPDGLHLYAARARGRRTVICGEQGIVLRSDDSGATFQRLKTPYRGSFFTLELPSDDEIVLGGLRGNVWRSSDSGLTWSRWVVPSDAAVTASATDDQGQVLLANQAGMVLGERSGRMEVLASGLAPINGLLVLPSGDALLMSMAGTLPVTLKHEVQRLNSSGAHK
ncbi:MAG: WD40/YVTN/BNR-like repeat-containing protein [Pigmentiphaga sp.]|uniref:WD40/YVTN/BNR-like repeat-containing protein n=1 Tax=Pigmentiphaga sp. TaxID=1977564 RepID=UPI003B5631D4